MSGKNKKVVGGKSAQKHIPGQKISTDNQNPIWMFDDLDRSGPFAFDLTREGFDHQDFLSKMISYSNMTWAEIKTQTHDNGKSKHHFLDANGFSKAAQERIAAKKKEQETDVIFSFAFNNTLRIIGTRADEKFHVIWYDINHEFYPSHKK